MTSKSRKRKRTRKNVEEAGDEDVQKEEEKEGCVIEEKTDYNGHDIKISKKKKNQEECAVLSASTPGGHFWTWHKTSRTCFVKSSNSGKYAVGHAVSGNSKCGCVIEKKTDYNGHDIKMSKKKKNQQECADFSASTPGGHFWTWHKTSKTCFVKSSNSGKYAVGHAVSGNIGCGA